MLSVYNILTFGKAFDSIADLENLGYLVEIINLVKRHPIIGKLRSKEYYNFKNKDYSNSFRIKTFLF